MPGRSLALISMASVCSGAAALMFQTLWTRAFSLILGSTVQAAAVAFAAFLCGLALGAYAAGIRSSRLKSALRAYAGVEALIAVTAVLSGLMLHGHADLLASWMVADDPLARLAYSFFGALALLVVPTFLMGATFPLMIEAWKQAGGDVRDVALIYGFNVFGAACGAMLCGYVLIRVLGVTLTLGAAASLNAAAAGLALAILFGRRAVPPAASRERAPEAAPQAGYPEAPLLAVVFLSGFAVLGLEIVWTRLASFFLGNRIFAITTLLGAILVLLALGSFAAAWLRRTARLTADELFASGFAAAAVGCLLSAFLALNWIPVQDTFEARIGAAGPVQLLRVATCFAFMLPVFLPLGVLFPLAISFAPRLQGSSGHVAGRYYLVNTAGVVLGSLSVGFLGVRTVGTLHSAALIGALCAAAAVGFWARARRSGANRARPALAVALASLAFASLMPSRIVLTSGAERLLYYREDEYGVFQVLGLPDGKRKVYNNRTELVFQLGHPLTSYVQEMQGHLGVFFHPAARTAAVLGSGYGITAGALTLHPGLTRIDAVEIIPGMIAAADLFGPYHHEYHRDPRVRIHADDGRHFMVRSPDRYDIVSVNVHDPRLPGASSLFHREFYEIVKSRLAPGGVVIQHAFGDDIAVVLATLASSFPYLRLLPSYGNGFNVVASERPLDVDARALQAVLEQEPLRESLARIGLLPPVSLPQFLRGSHAPRDLPGLFKAGVPVATDDRPAIEFSTTGNLLFSNQ